METTTVANKDKGFGSMSAAQKRLIAAMGGKAAHAMGRAHEWNKETAAAAGRKGGLRTAERKKAKKEQAAAEAAATTN